MTPHVLRHTRFDPRSRAGSDATRTTPSCSGICFDPRSRAGSDDLFQPRFQVGAVVSIRAPARGATRPRRRPQPADVFRSALPRGERPTASAARSPSKMFRSALPRGERPLHYKQRKGKAKVTGSREAGPAAPIIPRGGADNLQ